jgi:hypothetical protein
MLNPFDIPVTGLRQINLISEIQLATKCGCSRVTAYWSQKNLLIRVPDCRLSIGCIRPDAVLVQRAL